MKATFKLVALILALLFTTYSFAKEKYKYNDKQIINERFKVSPNVEIDIDNIFGDILIVEGTQNEVIIEVTIELGSNSKNNLEKMIGEVEIEISKSGNKIFAETSLGTFRNKTNVSGKKSSWNKSISIDYRITVPKDYIPTIKNQFGKIEINEVIADADIEIEFGVLNINKAGYLELDAEFSKVNIEEVEVVEIDKFSFGKLDITKLNRSFECQDIEFSKLKIDECSTGLERIDIDGEFTPINITIPETVIIKSNLDTEFGKITNEHSGSMRGSSYDAEVNIKTAFSGIKLLK